MIGFAWFVVVRKPPSSSIVTGASHGRSTKQKVSL
jgi:hypothetical protein